MFKINFVHTLYQIQFPSQPSVENAKKEKQRVKWFEPFSSGYSHRKIIYHLYTK